MLHSDQKPLTLAQAVASFPPAEDNLSFKQAVWPLLISIMRVMDKDTETKQKGMARRSFSIKNFLPHNPQQSPRRSAPLAFVMQIPGRAPEGLLLLKLPELCVLQRQEGRLRELEDSASFSAGAHGPHRTASFWFVLGSRWLLLVASVRGEVQDTHGVTWAWRLAEIPWSIWPGLDLPQQPWFIRNTEFSEARAWIRANNLCPWSLAKSLSRKKFIFCVKTKKVTHSPKLSYAWLCPLPPHPTTHTFCV